MTYYNKTKVQFPEKEFNNFIAERLRDIRRQATITKEDKKSHEGKE